jgi:IMP dehydrogenase
MIIKEALSYNDVLLIPQYSEIMSRHNVDISVEIDSLRKINIPIVSAPMDTIVGPEMIVKLNEFGTFAIAHRFCSIEEEVRTILLAKERVVDGSLLAGAIGAMGDFLERAAALVDAGVSILCIDTAHGHHKAVKIALKKLRDRYGSSIHLMAGNIATGEAFYDLARWGADSIRCGVGGGSICKTRMIAGSGVPVFQTILDCAKVKKELLLSTKIIADGGIIGSGEITKALGIGADFVMVGSALSGMDECPGNVYTTGDGQQYKKYRGAASREVQEEWRGNSEDIISEGVTTLVPYKGSVTSKIKKLIGGVKSGLSYSGASTIKEFQEKATFIKQTPAGQVESSPHILRK